MSAIQRSKQDGRAYPADITSLNELGQLARAFNAMQHTTSGALDRLGHMAAHDPLTGLPNRLLFGDRLAQALARAQRNRLHAALLYVDLDRFKFVNDTLGHEVGDQLLCKFAARVNEQTRRTDTLARLGGDEFGLILSDLESPGHAAVVADKIIQSMRLPFVIAGRELFITASVGIGIYPEDGADSSTIQKNADSAMYRAKASGSNNWQRFVPEMARAAADRLELEGSLRGATRSGQLEVHYQPIVDANRAIIGVEALARWRHPKLGLIEPSRFIPLAEETGAIMEIGQWVLRQAAQTRKRWQDDPTLPQVPMSLNISARQFAQRDFITMLTKTLQDVGVAPSDFEIELTESMLMQHVEQVADKLRELRALGIAIAIDDFGTGYSSLSYLQRLPIQRLKVDRSFTLTLSASDG